MNYNLQTLRGDVFGGVTSTVVALPFALSFGVASGMGAAAGLYGAIAVGFFAAVFGGTATQISGPTAPMAIVMAVIITNYAENLTEALTVVVLGGLFQALLGVLKLGRFVAYTPYVVVSGFMSGIGVLVMVIQVLPFFGSAPAPVIGKVPTGLPGLQLGLPSLSFLARAVEPALILALIGSVVSLLTCLVADSLTRTSHDPDRELIGQGVGNAFAGLIGGLPGAGTPVYTVPNIRSGGRTRAAGARFRLGPSLEVSLEASLTESRSDEKPASGLVLRGTKRW